MDVGREIFYLMKGGEKYKQKKFKGSYLLMSIVVIGCNPQAKLSSMIVSFITKKIAAFAASLSLIEFVIFFFGESCIALCG